jgi:hypothetical protein
LFLTAFINQKLKEELHLGQYYSVEQIARAVLRLGLDVQDQYLIDEENKKKRLRGEKVLGRLIGLDSTNIKEAKVFFYEADQVLNHYHDKSILTDARGKALPRYLKFAVPGYSVSNIEALQRTWNRDAANQQAQRAARLLCKTVEQLDNFWL